MAAASAKTSCSVKPSRRWNGFAERFALWMERGGAVTVGEAVHNNMAGGGHFGECARHLPRGLLRERARRTRPGEGLCGPVALGVLCLGGMWWQGGQSATRKATRSSTVSGEEPRTSPRLRERLRAARRALILRLRWGTAGRHASASHERRQHHKQCKLAHYLVVLHASQEPPQYLRFTYKVDR